MINKFVVGIQARVNSSRMKKKNFFLLGKKKLCEWSIIQAKSYFPNSSIYLLVPIKDKASFLKIAKSNKINLLGGSEEDVLSRFENLARIHNDSTIVRWTADNPIKCKTAMSALLKAHNVNYNNYCCYQGLRKTAVELIPAKLLLKIRGGSNYTKLCNEHVTFGLTKNSKKNTYILSNKFLKLPKKIDNKFTVDYYSDYIFVKNFIKKNFLNPQKKISLENYNLYLKKNNKL